jgi:hypothetical protein
MTHEEARRIVCATYNQFKRTLLDACGQVSPLTERVIARTLSQVQREIDRDPTYVESIIQQATTLMDRPDPQ